MTKVKSLQFLSMFGALVVLGGGCLGSGNVGTNNIATPSGDKINVETARTTDEHSVGLSGREDVGDGMLFCFNESKQQEFWMLGMMVPIDMIWIKDGVVISVSPEVPLRENNNITRRNSGGNVNAVLEVAEGEASNLGIEEGSMLEDVARICK